MKDFVMKAILSLFPGHTLQLFRAADWRLLSQSAGPALILGSTTDLCRDPQEARALLISDDGTFSSDPRVPQSYPSLHPYGVVEPQGHSCSWSHRVEQQVRR